MKNKYKTLLLSLICFLTILGIGSIKQQVMAKEVGIVVISSYDLVSGTLAPSEEVELEFTIKNTSKNSTVKNLIITYEAQDQTSVYPVFGKTNQVYVGQLNPKQEEKVKVKMVLDEKLQERKVIVQMLLTYALGGDSQDGGTTEQTGIENTVAISLPITLNSALDINNLMIAPVTTVNAKTLVSFSCKNNGSVDLYNVVVHIDGNIDDSMKRIELGKMKVTEMKSQDSYVIFARAGTEKLKVYLTYEDEAGNSYQGAVQDYEVTVKEEDVVNVLDDSKQDSTRSENKVALILTNIGLFLLSILIIVAIIVIVRKRKK